LEAVIMYVGRIKIISLIAGVAIMAGSPVAAIDVKLEDAAVKKAVEEGKQMKDVKTVPTRFGADLSKDLCGGGGEIQTKTVGLNRLGALIAADPDRAERDKPQVEQAIQKTADAKRLKIVFDFCGDTVDFAEDAQATLEQDGRMIKGEMAKPDQAKKNPEGPAYRGKIAASFPYGSFDPNAMTKITLYPKTGDAMSWDVDLSKIK
jgi:hypothetical protein